MHKFVREIKSCLTKATEALEDGDIEYAKDMIAAASQWIEAAEREKHGTRKHDSTTGIAVVSDID